MPSAQWLVDNFDTSQAFCERLGPCSRDRLREAVLTELRNEFGDGPFALTAHAHIATAIK